MRYILVLLIFFCTNITSFANLKILEEVLQDYLANKFLNASFIFANSNNNLIVGAKGIVSSYGERLKVNEKMPIPAAIKPIIATAILRLQDKGLLEINNKISKYIDQDYCINGIVPDFAKKITIHHLLTHTSGIPEYFGRITINSTMTHKDIIKKILEFSSREIILSKVGKNFEYSNSNFIILGLIIEKVGKKTLKDFLQDEFFTPLKMKSTYLLTLQETLQKNYSTADYPERYYVQPNYGNPKFILVDNTSVIPYADGGIISNTFDLIKWHRALHQGKILSKQSYELMIRKHFLIYSNVEHDKIYNTYYNIIKTHGILLDDKIKAVYTGYGIIISKFNNKDIVLHNPGGWRGVGIRNEMGYIPSRDFYYVILSNVTIQIPESLQTKYDMNDAVNQLDISYFKRQIIHCVLGIINN